MVEGEAAGSAIVAVSEILLTEQVLSDQGHGVLSRIGQEIKRTKKATFWTFAIDRGEPVTFATATDHAGNEIVPILTAKGVSVYQGLGTTPSFSALDIALEIKSRDPVQQVLARWHLDLANKTATGWQEGPRTHLQYGGHIPDKEVVDHPLKAPRWCHPPMEVVLLSEMVAANFFHDKWEIFRDNPTWTRSIKLFEQLCYTHYVNKLKSCICTSGSPTALQSMWASNWT